MEKNNAISKLSEHNQLLWTDLKYLKWGKNKLKQDTSSISKDNESLVNETTLPKDTMI